MGATKNDEMMTVADIVDKLDLTVFSGQKGLGRKISGGYVSDLLSDVMGNADAGQLWITLQTHRNVMAIASLKELAAVVMVSGNKPADDTTGQSNEEDIPVLGTSLSCFDMAGKLYELLKNNA